MVVVRALDPLVGPPVVSAIVGSIGLRGRTSRGAGMEALLECITLPRSLSDPIVDGRPMLAGLASSLVLGFHITLSP